MSKNSICLNMIVKNEAHVIIKTLTNLCSHINFSYWVICDTGSTDNTKELISEFFNEKGIKGELYDHEWKDFGHNRSLALACAYNKTDLLFIFDADDEIVGNLVLPNTFDCDRYTFTFGSGFVYVRPLLVNNRKKWGFKGVLHEFLIDLEPVKGSKNIEGDYYINSGRTGNRSKNPNKYIDDATILKKAHYDILESDYNLSCRYAFYCAQSFKDSGEKYVNDAIEWYQKCLGLKMWTQEQYVSCLTIGDLYSRQNDMPNALKYWYKTIEFDSERLEGIINAINYLRNNGQHLLVNALYHKFKNYNKKPQGKLFMFDSVYKDQLEYNNTISAFYVNDKISGYECCKRIFINNELSYNLMKLSISNFIFYIDLFNKDTDINKLQLFYSFDNLIRNICLKNEMIEEIMIKIWNKLFDECRILLTKPSILQLAIKKQKNIFISFTTCKRLDLFKETVYSMLNHWNDIDKIDYWFCVDDNSSNEDRQQMKKLFPWIQFYMKTGEEKGHRQSMNIIYNKLNELKPTYWIHMEDDFLFHKKLNYIDDSIAALNSKYCLDNNVKQILFNRNYGEIIDSYNSKGHISNDANSDIVLHNHCNGIFNYPNCHYWPHYSFRPSLIEVKPILELGNFDSNNKFFELDYAKKWEKAGYTSAFFNRITCRHIGRLTSDRNTKVVKNAYDLNNEEQFFEKKASRNNIKIVNLERRADRKEETNKKLIDSGIKTDHYDFIKAVDGKELKPTSELKYLFRNNDFGNRRGVIGCALSHYKLWCQLLNDSDNEYYIIMEDDFTLCNNFKQHLETLQTNNEFSKRDVLFLGYHMFQKNRQTHFQLYNTESNSVNVEPLDRKLYIGGTFSYSINKNGAKILMDYIEKNGIKHGIDYHFKIIDTLDSYECQPQIVFSEWNENGKQIDSDIQNIYDSIDFKNIIDELEQIKEKYIFIPKLDIIGNDMYFKKTSLEEQFFISEKDPNCIGFNTLGFFKNKIDIDTLKPSIYFKERDGIYIKKSFYKDYLDKKQIQSINNICIRIKMLCNWTSSEQLCKEWSNMCETEFKWKNYELVWTDVKEDIDYYVIINYPPKDAYFDPNRTIVFQMEPWVNDLNKNWGVKTWGKWAEPDPNIFLAVRGRKTNHHNNAFWQLEFKLNDFQKSELFEKTKGTIVSSICSSKYFDEGHIARIDFLKFLETKGDLQLDIYNKDNNHQFKNYRGAVSPYIDKSNGLAPYKYYFMIENNYETNFITEKLWEPILCETLVFYYGCPNVTDYVDSRAFVQLDITDFEKSYQIIKQAINEDWWSQRIDIIRQEKRKILNELAFFPTIEKIITSKQNNLIKIVVARYNENIDWTTQFSNLLIYNKGTRLGIFNEILLDNVGREGHTYYKYIYDNYYNLNDYTIFLQGNPFDHSPNIIQNLKKYIYKNNLDLDFEFLSETISNCNLSGCKLHYKLELKTVYEKIFNIKRDTMEFQFGQGSQFIVSKTQILSRPREFYLNIVKILDYDKNPIEGYVIERFHKLIFANETFNKLKNITITGNERQIAIKNLLKKCAINYDDTNILDMKFNTHDRGNKNINDAEYSMCYNKEISGLDKYCGPDWVFYHWPSADIKTFEQTKNEIIIEANKVPIIDKIGWYGNLYSPLNDVIEYKTRPLLKKIGDENSELFHIVHIPPRNGIIDNKIPDYLSLYDLVKYKYLIDIGGNGWSGRLKFLLFSKRPLLLVDRNYVEYFYNDLKPYVHFIPVKMDLSDLLEKVKWMKTNYEECLNIANNAYNFANINFTSDKLMERIYTVYQNIKPKNQN
jgi:GR25 family glycosyltransferase involved in LPS biosynthesis